jgi:hypothetical protein
VVASGRWLAKTSLNKRSESFLVMYTFWEVVREIAECYC